MDETDREPAHDAPQGGDRGPGPDDRGPRPDERGPAGGRGPAGEGPRPEGQPWRGDGRGRRRGRRGRGGRPPMGAPQFGGAPPPPREDEGSSQMREIAAYERRQRQPPRGPWRGPGAGAGGSGFRPQGPGAGPRPFTPGRPPFGPRPGGFRPGGAQRQQRYQEMVRRATAGPRTGVPAEEGGEPVSGPHAVLEALRAGRQIRRIYVAQERGVRTGATSDVIREAQEKRVMVRFVDRVDVERLSPGVEHQGVVAIAEGRQGVELDELLLHLETLTEPPLVLVIDSLQDPQNFGVLLRSAEGAGVDGVVIPRHRQVGLTPAVARTSAGASEHLLIADVANLRQAIDALKERGVWVVGTDDSGDMEWDEVDYRGATAIVVGGEGEGIRRLVLEGCDQVVRITMQGQVSSLNAAAAGTVVLFEALRQRVRDSAPPQVERPERPPAESEAPAGEEEQDLLLDEEAPTGDAVRGDDRDVEEFAEAAEAEGDTDVTPDALGPEEITPTEAKPKRARKKPEGEKSVGDGSGAPKARKRPTRKKTAE